MKIYIFTFIVALLIISCENSNEPGLEIVSSGIVKKLEVSTWQYGTHTLNDEEGKILYALKSSTKDLNAYNDLKVTLLGSRVDGYPVDGGPLYLDVIAVKELDN